MHHEAEEIFKSLVIKIEKDPKVVQNTRPGLCRLWTNAVLDVVEKESLPISAKVFAEAKEVTVHIGLQHTFVLLVIEVEQAETRFILDGTGVLDHLPYFGLESKAPSHLQNSRPDQINRYRLLNKKDK